ncbi:MAG: GNAT family N-acetyltransferase [Bacteroidetes bacterium]|nr:MAG: GNAT family N-acetyltransferase [Bacteroidota bacterium]
MRSPNVIHQLEHNFNLHACQLAGLTRGMYVYRTDAITFVDSGLSCDTFNIIHITDGVSLSRRELENVLDHFHTNQREYCIWINEINLTSRVERMLQELSLSRQNEETGMRLDLRHYKESRNSGRDTVRIVDSRELLITYATVIAANWTPPDSNILKYFEKTASHYLDSRNPILLFLNYRDDIPASTLEFFPTDQETAGIYGFSTLEAHRGTGSGSALLEAALDYAQTAGYRYVLLQATEAAIGIYKRYGFREITRYFEYA